MREFLARIIEGDSRRGARVDLGIDLRPKALSLDGSPPEFIVPHYEVQKVTMKLQRCGRAGNQENGWRNPEERSFKEAHAR